MWRRYYIVSLCCWVGAIPAMGQVRAWEDTITLPTYQEDLPDPAPPFFALNPDRASYPYANRTNLTGRQAPQVWRRLNLENEYLACSFLPDLGGHLYSCTDKRNGQPMFHANPSIKKALIGLRGAWVSLGIELNFPATHSRDTVSPVNFGLEQEKDRAAVWVGKTDRVSGTEWMVEFSLRAGSPILQQDVTLRNGTPVRHPYLWWTNAAVELDPDTRFVVPTRLWILHGNEPALDTWPVSSAGVDLRVVANYKDGTGLFAYGTREPFFAIVQPSRRTAVVHYADPATVPGKKLWTWGTQSDAGVRQGLSDNHTNYVEIQAGPFPTQNDYGFLAPHSSKSFTEYWIPGYEVSGVSRANLHGVLNFERGTAGGKMVLGVQLDVTHAVPGARIRVLNGTRPVLEETADLSPGKAFSRQVPDPAAGTAYHFELLDASGKLLLAHTEGQYDITDPSTAKLGKLPPPNWGSDATQQFYLGMGEYNELHSQNDFADGDYERGLKKFADSAALKKAAGRLAVERNRFEQAERLLAEAAAGSPADAEIHYYRGLAQRGLGNEEGARKEWELAGADASFAAAADVETAASLARTGQRAAALDLLHQILEKEPNLVEAGRMEVAVLRASGQTDAARQRLQYWRTLDPIDPFLRLESVTLGAADDSLWPHLAADPERVLDIVDQYLALAFYHDALAILGRTYPQPAANQMDNGALLPQANPLLAYYRGYCRKRLGGNPVEDFAKAARLPLDYVFPNRSSSFPVLETALGVNHSDASAHWLMGLLYMDSHLPDEAIQEWRTAHSLHKYNPMLDTVLADTLVRVKKDNAGALAILKGSGKTLPSAARAAPAPPPPMAGQPPDLIAAMALRLAAGGNLEQALEMFTTQNFPQEKQSANVRQAYIELRLQRLRILATLQRCDLAQDGIQTFGGEDKRLVFTMYGFERAIKSARFQYYIGSVEDRCGNSKAARKRWSKVAKGSEAQDSPDFAFPLLASLRLQEADVKPRLSAEAAKMGAAAASAAPDSRGQLLYSEGMLWLAAGETEKAAAAFRDGSAAPDRENSKFLNLLALHEGAGAGQ